MRENRYENHHEKDRNSHSSSDLIKKEQDYRHKWQDKFLKSHILTFRLGQIFGFAYNLAVLAVVYKLIQQEESALAIKIFFGNIALIGFALLVTTVERKVLSKKPVRKGRDFKHFKNHRRKEAPRNINSVDRRN